MAAQLDSDKQSLHSEAEKLLSAILAHENLGLNNFKKVKDLAATNKALESQKEFNNLVFEISIIEKFLQEMNIRNLQQLNAEDAREEASFLEQKYIEQQKFNEFMANNNQAQTDPQQIIRQAIEDEYKKALQKLNELEHKLDLKILECDNRIAKLTEIIKKIDKKTDSILQKILSDVEKSSEVREIKINDRIIPYALSDLSKKAREDLKGRYEDGTLNSAEFKADAKEITKLFISDALTENNIDPKSIDATTLDSIVSLETENLINAIENHESIQDFHQSLNNRITYDVRLNKELETKKACENGKVILTNGKNECSSEVEQITTKKITLETINSLNEIFSDVQKTCEASQELLDAIENYESLLPDDLMDFDLTELDLTEESDLADSISATKGASIIEPSAPEIPEPAPEHPQPAATSTASLFQKLSVSKDQVEQARKAEQAQQAAEKANASNNEKKPEVAASTPQSTPAPEDEGRKFRR